MATDAPPLGWTSRSGIVEPSEDVAGYAARRQMVRGVCRAQGCRRRVELDPTELRKVGLGQLAMRTVQKLWLCQRLDGCGLDFHSEPPLIPLRLEQFVGKPNVRLRLRCRGAGCKYFRVWRVEEMIAALQKRGQGDARSEVAKLSPMMKSPCPLCQRSNWTAEVLWVNTDTMGWRQLGERSFDTLRP